MKKEKVYVLVKEEPEYLRFEVVGVFTEDGRRLKLKEFADKEREMLHMFLRDSANMIETLKQKRAEIAYGDAKLLENAGRHLSIAEIHVHEKSLKEIEGFTQQIALFTEHANKASEYSDEKLAHDYMVRSHLVFQEFEVE